MIDGTVAVTVDDEGDHQTGKMAVVPPNAPHSVRIVGEETAAVLASGFFPAGEERHEFDEPVMPFGPREPVSKEGTDSDDR